LSGIFISYRRNDSQGEAGRLFDDLAKHFGESSVFMDVAAIEAGRDFRKAIEEGVTKCGVLLVMIGMEWVDAKDERGARRLNDPSDFVRIETASALKRDIPVIPVLVRGAKMPSAEQLPDDLKELAYRNSIELTHARWRSDVQLLIEALRRLLGDSEHPQIGAAAGQAAGQGGGLQGERVAAPKLGSGNAGQIAAQFDPAALQRAARELALRIGPIASIVVKRAAAQCNSLEELYRKVAEEIDLKEEREKFLREAVAIDSSFLVRTVESAAILAPQGLAQARERRMAAEPAQSGERREETIAASAATKDVQPPRRGKYWLVIAAGLVLVLILLFVLRFAPVIGAGSSKPNKSATSSVTPPNPQHAPEPPAIKGESSASAVPTGAEREKLPQRPVKTVTDQIRGVGPKRVQISAELAKSLLIHMVSAPYPLLARQANVDGAVVLDADISSDGRVERVMPVSGPGLLMESAIAAAKQFQYKPYTQNGVPVPVKTQIVIQFTLKPQ
jgi:TonB family protein